MDWQEVVKTATILVLILDPFGNAPVFNSILSAQPKKRRAWIIFRELVFALIFLIGFLIAGEKILSYLGLTQYALSISGGVLLFIISLKMIFPAAKPDTTPETIEEPFIVPLAMPLVAGPSVIAVLLLMSSGSAGEISEPAVALLLAWGLTSIILVSSPFILGALGPKMSNALERLMGMILVILSVQMLLNGIQAFAESLAL